MHAYANQEVLSHSLLSLNSHTYIMRPAICISESPVFVNLLGQIGRYPNKLEFSNTNS